MEGVLDSFVTLLLRSLDLHTPLVVIYYRLAARNMKLLQKRISPRKDGAMLPSDIALSSALKPLSLSSGDTASPNNRSLGCGSFRQSGLVNTFTASPSSRQKNNISRTDSPKRRIPSLRSLVAAPVVFKRHVTTFLRVADLQMDETMSLHSDGTSDRESINHPNFHHVSINPPPGILIDPLERWVALDNGDGEHAPIAPYAVQALVKTGSESVFDEDMWKAGDAKTSKLVKSATGWHAQTWNQAGCIEIPSSKVGDETILLWSGKFNHGFYGSDLPAARTAAIIRMSPETLMNLLVDSTRVKEYNKMSLGRTDILVLQKGLEGAFGGITKVMKSESRPPLLRKTLELISLMHAAELPDGSGFIIVSRAVTTPEDRKPKPKNLLKSEILMGINIIKRVKDDDTRCLFISVNHISSPMVPLMIAKRIGLQAATSFIHDLRACCA